MIVEHLTYDTLEDRYDNLISTTNQTKQDFSNAGEKLNRYIYDYVVTDSKTERSFVTELDTSEEVVVYAKLPRGFFIPIPVGDYYPDWAVAFKEGTVKPVYLVAQTKGSLSSMQLREVEKSKLEWRPRVLRVAERQGQYRAGEYDVVTDYVELRQLVG